MNLPNKISISRICLLPLVMFFYMETFFDGGKLVAGIIFIIACLTDFLDGYIARKYNMVTTLGKFLDTIADKVMVMTAMLLLVAVPISSQGETVISYPADLGGASNAIATTCFIIILAREFLISAFRQIAASKNVIMQADKLGKIKAVFQDVTLVLYFINAFLFETYPSVMTGAVALGLTSTAFALLLVTTVLTVASAVNYIVKNKKVFNDKD